MIRTVWDLAVHRVKCLLVLQATAELQSELPVVGAQLNERAADLRAGLDGLQPPPPTLAAATEQPETEQPATRRSRKTSE